MSAPPFSSRADSTRSPEIGSLSPLPQTSERVRHLVTSLLVACCAALAPTSLPAQEPTLTLDRLVSPSTVLRERGTPQSPLRSISSSSSRASRSSSPTSTSKPVAGDSILPATATNSPGTSSIAALRVGSSRCSRRCPVTSCWRTVPRRSRNRSATYLPGAAACCSRVDIGTWIRPRISTPSSG